MELFDPQSYEIPDSDAKIYMSLDDIIKLEGIKKPGPGSVRSVASRRSTYSHKSNQSHRSTYSNRSHRSTYSNRSHRSTFSNRSNRSHRSTFSNRSNRSQRSTYSNKSNRSHYSGYNSRTHYLIQSNGFGGHGKIRRYDDALSGMHYTNLRRPGVYTSNGRVPLQYYRHAVKNAVRTLTNRVSKPRNHMVGIRRYKGFQNRQMFLNRWRNFPADINVEIKNTNVPPLTRKSLKLFNQLNNPRVHSSARTYGSHSSFSMQSNYCRRHSVRRSLNQFIQRQIKALQVKASKSANHDYLSNMEFSPTPHVTQELIHDRFSSYD